MSGLVRDKKPPGIVTSQTRTTTSESIATRPSLQSPRTPRFAEATAVNSPIDPPASRHNPFRDPPADAAATNHFMAQPQPADVGFGYINKHQSVEMPNTDPQDPARPASPLKSPLKSAMKTPGAPPRDLRAVLSPTFQHEDLLEKQEAHTEKEQARDLRIKTRIRVAKLLLRGVNFSCSLIVVAMIAAIFTIFNATKALAPRNSLPPWAPNQMIWPQITLLVIACVSLFASIIVFYAYYKGGHRRAEKVAVYYTIFACAFFIISIVMWCLGAGLLQGSRNNSDGKDMWGWSCKDNVRKELFEDDVSYDLICRLSNWSLVCCIIEVVVETLVIAIYAVVFYRFYSKRKLRQSMAARDRARSDLYVAQLRSQSAPPTPAVPHTPAPVSPRPAPEMSTVDDSTQYATASPTSTMTSTASTKPFRLRPPPIKIHTATSPSAAATAADPNSARPPTASLASPGVETQQDHFHAAPGEQVYAAVEIPGAYDGMRSPSADESFARMFAQEGPIRAPASPR